MWRKVITVVTLVLQFHLTAIQCTLSNKFQPGQVELRVYASETSVLNINTAQLLWHAENLDYKPSAEDALPIEHSTTLQLSKSMQNNGSIFLHAVFNPQGNSKAGSSVRAVQRANNYLPRKTVRKERNLLKEEYEEDPHSSLEIVSFWRKKLSVHLVEDFTTYQSQSEMTPLSWAYYSRQLVDSQFYPIVYVNVQNILEQMLIPLNDTLDSVPVELSYSSIPLDKWDWYKQLEATFQLYQSWGSSEKEIEDVKATFLGTNKVLLYVTSVVAFFHILFDFLAFKNDVSFWRSNKSLAGLSVRTLFLNCVSQFIVLLYLIDSEASILVVGSIGVGLLIEIWKIFKAGTISIWLAFGFIPMLYFKEAESYSQSSTKEFDKMAFKYVGSLLIPCLLGYATYSLYFQKHVGWYSWGLGSLTAIVHSLGFVRMTPQLFINYKLKSVAHLPWRAFMYKAINTFIDDLFAFIIHMPTMHRLSCLRDDFVFLIYLYQRWIYPVDKTRVNEFGQGGDEADKKDEDKTKKEEEVLKKKEE